MIAILSLTGSAAAQEKLPPGAEVRQNLQRILSSGEYETARPDADPVGSFWARLARKIGELLRGLTRLGESSPFLYWVILVVCLVVLTAIFTHGGIVLARALRASHAGRAGLDEARGARPDDWAALLERAAGEARQGRFTEAIRLCHRAALMGLDRRGIVRFHESFTSGDYRRQLRPRARERTLFDSLARLYEPAFFGRIPAGNPEYSESLRLARTLAQETPA